jgi:hypothetical protein
VPTLNLQVGASADDAHAGSITDNSGRAVASGAVILNPGVGVGTSHDLTNTQVSPGSHGANSEVSAGFRFTNVTIAQGETITAALFKLRALATYNAGANVIRYHVSAQAADNPIAFALGGDVGGGGCLRASGAGAPDTNRPRTTADAGPWTVTSISTTGGPNLDGWYELDVTAVVQEIVNRGGWVSGNALVILVDCHADTTSGEWQDWHSYNGTPANAAKLDITYGGAGTPTSDAGQRDQRLHPRPVMRRIAA